MNSEQDAGGMPVEYLPVAEFTKAFGIGVTTTYALIGEGKLKSVKIGKRRLIRVAAAREYFASQEALR